MTSARPVHGLTVLYDAECVICRRARRWVERHRQIVPVRFVPVASAEARRRFPALDVARSLGDVTVVTDGGAVYRGDRAWIAVLWAVARTRSLANDLARGRHRRLFGGVTGAADTIRRLSAGQADPGRPGAPDEWPPPQVGACRGGAS